ncbi:unnamed protein product [Cladocopium goreaui]|uniref:Uncharacterized protein n=1 Tax=Cladocopium goreaui TaxID=2562237 RepID=A0A9P1FVV5_9DINO|nr:unnamed protein product [Cladocopium goreaui]
MYVYIADLHFDNICTPSSLQNFTKHGGKVKSPDGSASESGPKETKDSDQQQASEADAGPEIVQAAEPEQEAAASIVESVLDDVQVLSTERASASDSGADVQVKSPDESASESGPKETKDSDQQQASEADAGPEIVQAAAEPEQDAAASIVESVLDDVQASELQQIAAEPKPAALKVLPQSEPVQQDEEEEEEGVMEVWEESEGGHESFDGSDAGW